MRRSGRFVRSVVGRVTPLLPLAIGVLVVLAFNPVTFEAWWLRYPDVPRDWAVKVWGWDVAILAVAVVLALVARRAARRKNGAEWRRHLGAYVLMLLVGVLMAALVLEVYLRISGTRAAFSPSLRRELSWRARHAGTSGAPLPEASYAFSPTLGWELRPNVRTERVTSNSQALRGSREYTTEPGAETLRVLCVGDSLTFGAGLRDEETMPARLEAVLNGDRGSRWEVLNFGVEGYGTDQQWLYFAEKGLRYKPDVVVLAFFELNLERNVMSFRDYAKPYFTLVGGRLALRNVPVPSPPEVLARQPELPRIRLASLVGTLAEEFRMSMSLGDLAYTRAGAVTLAILDAMREAVSARGARFVLMSIPRPITRRGSDTERMLATWAARTGTPFVNLRAAYVKLPEAERARLYSGHWTPYGADVAARLLADELRRVRQRPTAEWNVSEHPELRIVPDELWLAARARFQQLATVYVPRQERGRLAGRNTGSPSSRTSLFSGLLRCGVCGGGLVVVNGHPIRQHRRYGCGFHRDKGPQVCRNGLTVKVGTVETRLVAALQEHVLHPGAVQYVVTAVNRHFEAFQASQNEERRRLEADLAQVEAELKNVEAAILAGLAGKTTAALLQDRESRWEMLQDGLQRLSARSATGPLQVNTEEIRARLEHLDGLLQQDSARANAIFRQMLEPITLIPVEKEGKRFYRASGTARGAEMLDRLGLAQAVDFGGCGGWICRMLHGPRTALDRPQITLEARARYAECYKAHEMYWIDR